MISSIKTWMFNKSLKEHTNFKSNREFSGINNCASYCIIASGDTSSIYATQAYKRKLEGLKKRVDVLYFQDNKAASENGYSRSNVKWNGVPEHELIDAMLSREYDLLLFLYPKMENHLKYLAILCNAKFKIGPAFENSTHIFDLMIESQDYKETEKFIQEIDKQLKLISI